jgi:predicted AlkP superfamily phosphohydrolase/phosphomutase
MRCLLLGFDAFDPITFERLNDQGQMPNLAGYVQRRQYNRLEVSNPPQSEVSWTSIASGLNPGGHGLFDFVHRNPSTYSIYASLLPTGRGVGGRQFIRPSGAGTIFDQAAGRGYPATTLWWPGTYPARPDSPVRAIPGLGTPDIQGRLGVGELFTTDSGRATHTWKTPVRKLTPASKGLYLQELSGPKRSSRSGADELKLPFQLEVLDEKNVRLKVDGSTFELCLGKWSPIIELKFKAGLFIKLGAVTRAIVTRLDPEVEIYFTPLQIHPLQAVWRYGSPGGFVKDLWKASGPFLTLGWPQDTTALEDDIITDGEFLDLCDSIFQNRVQAFLYLLSNFREGILGAVFDSLDRVQHMFWKDHPEIVRGWYFRLDSLAGLAKERFSPHPGEDDRFLILSDHGFSDFDYKVHLNRWLIQRGYLVPRRESAARGEWADIDWDRSRAYAIGLNSIYLNLEGREAKGQVHLGQRQALLAEIMDCLTTIEGPDGRPAVQTVWRNEDALSGPLAKRGPDLLVGYSTGYRASPQTGLGGWEKEVVEPNRDHWRADHCFNPQSVPGVIFSDHDLGNFPSPSYYDIPSLTIGEAPESGGFSPPPDSSEDDETLQERLKSLGYL